MECNRTTEKGMQLEEVRKLCTRQLEEAEWGAREVEKGMKGGARENVADQRKRGKRVQERKRAVREKVREKSRCR